MGEKNFLLYDINGDIVPLSFEDWTIEEKVLLLQETQTELNFYINKRKTLHIEIGDIIFKPKDNSLGNKEWNIMKERDEEEVAKFLFKLLKYPDDEVQNQRFENYSDNFRKISEFFKDLAILFDNASYCDKIILQLETLEKQIKQNLKIW